MEQVDTVASMKKAEFLNHNCIVLNYLGSNAAVIIQE